MKKGMHTITTTTATYAMMAQRVLAENGIPSRIVRTTGEAQARGCAYGIEIDVRKRADARAVLTRRGIPCKV